MSGVGGMPMVAQRFAYCIGSIIIHAQTPVARDTTDAPQIVEHIKKSLTFTPFCTRWIPCSAKFVVLGQNPRATGAMQVIAR